MEFANPKKYDGDLPEDLVQQMAGAGYVFIQSK